MSETMTRKMRRAAKELLRHPAPLSLGFDLDDQLAPVGDHAQVEARGRIGRTQSLKERIDFRLQTFGCGRSSREAKARVSFGISLVKGGKLRLIIIAWWVDRLPTRRARPNWWRGGGTTFDIGVIARSTAPILLCHERPGTISRNAQSDRFLLG